MNRSSKIIGLALTAAFILAANDVRIMSSGSWPRPAETSVPAAQTAKPLALDILQAAPVRSALRFNFI